jgi:hypothetical protein
MLLQGHTTPNHPSHPLGPTDSHGGGGGTGGGSIGPPTKPHAPAKGHQHRHHPAPKAPKPTHHNRITNARPVGRRSAPRFALTPLEEVLELIGMKIDGHIH